MTVQLTTLESEIPDQASDDIGATVMTVLRGIRPSRSDGQPYHEENGLTDAGFSSLDMVKVMLGVEAAFDLMIPQDLITPENFRSGGAIAAMIRRLKSAQ
jgi:acyl carrier protein